MKRDRPLAPSRFLRTTQRIPGGGRHRAPLVARSRIAIAHGSRNFATASRLFDRKTRERVWMLYAWRQRCEELTDQLSKKGAEESMGGTGGTGRTGGKGDPVKHIRIQSMIINQTHLIN